MKSIQRGFLVVLVLFILFPGALWGDTHVYYYETLVANRYDIAHRVVKGYSSGMISPDFYSNDWDAP